MGQQIETLAQFAATTQWEDIPGVVQEHAKLVLLDTLGVILAGSQRPDVQQLRGRLAATAGSGATVLARGFPAQDPRTAAMLNGIAGRSIELCEGLRQVSGQAAMQILPGVLAVGEQTRSTGREIITSLVLGYDIAARLGMAFTPRPLAHQNGQAMLLAAASAGARLHELDAAGVSLSMRIATTILMTPSYTNAIAGATALNVPGGMSGYACALAPELAIAGFTAQEDAIEEALGKLAGDGFNPEGLLDELGSLWQITRNYFRLYACCNPIHPSLDCLHDILARLRPRPGDIERIDFATYGFAAAMRSPHPENYFASKYSLPHAAAVMVVKGNAGYHAIDDGALHDPVIAMLRDRVHVVEDPEMSAVAPRLRPARVVVTLKDGRQVSHSVESHRGDFHQPFEESALRMKFRELAGAVLNPEGIDAVETAVDRCEQWPDMSDFLQLLNRHARS